MPISNSAITLERRRAQSHARATPRAIAHPVLLLVVVMSLGCAGLLGGEPPSADTMKDAAQQKARASADAKVGEARDRALRESGLDRIEGIENPTPKQLTDAKAARKARRADLDAARGSALRWPWGMARKQEKLRDAALQLPKGPWREGLIRCGRGECDAWYWLYIADPARIVVEAKGPSSSALPGFGLTLHNGELEVIGSSFATSEGPRRVDGELEPGLYYVKISVQDKSGIQLSYKLRATDYAPPPLPRKTKAAKPARRSGTSSGTSSAAPRTTPQRAVASISSELLEVEQSGGQPVAVLLEAGLADGVRKGLTGELVEAGSVIGRIEIVGVFSGGSRARIVGGLKRAISLDTTARVFLASP